jgi:hypothetical protein
MVFVHALMPSNALKNMSTEFAWHGTYTVAAMTQSRSKAFLQAFAHGFVRNMAVFVDSVLSKLVEIKVSVTGSICHATI